MCRGEINPARSRQGPLQEQQGAQADEGEQGDQTLRLVQRLVPRGGTPTTKAGLIDLLRVEGVVSRRLLRTRTPERHGTVFAPGLSRREAAPSACGSEVGSAPVRVPRAEC